MCRKDDLNTPVDMLFTRMPVPPVIIRPSVVADLKGGTNEDDLTIKLTELIMLNTCLQKSRHDGAPFKTINDMWENHQVRLEG